MNLTIPIYKEFRGSKGKIIFNDKTEYEITFQIYLLNAGNTIGSIFFSSFDTTIEDRFNNSYLFTFEGIDNNNLKIISNNCIMFSLEHHIFNNPKFPMYTGHFYLSNIQIFDNEDINYFSGNTSNLLIEVALNNFYTNSKIIIDTEIGPVEISNITNKQQYTINKFAHIPFISSVLTIRHQTNRMNFNDIKADIINTILKILEILSLAKFNLIQWVYLTIYLKNSKPIFLYSEINKLLPHIPNSLNFVPDNELQNFLNQSYQNYKENVNFKYNFSLSLHWFLESLSLKPSIINLINASTGFEAILNKFHSTDQSEFILNHKLFESLYKSLVKSTTDILANKVDESTINSICTSLKYLNIYNRRSYQSKSKELLQHLGLWNNDIETDFRQIKKLRDKITHTGNITIENKEIASLYFKFINILGNVFLRILSYEKTYAINYIPIIKY